MVKRKTDGEPDAAQRRECRMLREVEEIQSAAIAEMIAIFRKRPLSYWMSRPRPKSIERIARDMSHRVAATGFRVGPA